MTLSVYRIQRYTAQHHGIGLCAMLSDSRDAKVSRARHQAMFLARRLPYRIDRKGKRKPRYSFLCLAAYFDRKDHTTIVHAVKKIERQLPNDLQAQVDLSQIINRLNGIGE